MECYFYFIGDSVKGPQGLPGVGLPGQPGSPGPPGKCDCNQYYNNGTKILQSEIFWIQKVRLLRLISYF